MEKIQANNAKRDLTIDVAKGIGIFLVVLAHTTGNDFTHKFIYLFHMPLFFLLAGMTINYSIKQQPKEFIYKKIKKIIIPYLFFCIISFIYWLIIERKVRNQMNISVINNFLNIFLGRAYEQYYSYNVAMWFLPCLFTSELISYFILKYTKNNFMRFIVSTIILILGYVLCCHKLTLVFALETAFIAQFFIIIGFLFKTFLTNRFNKITKLLFIIVSVFSILLSLLFKNNIAMLGHTYGNLLLFTSGALGGSYIVYFLAKIAKNNRILIFLGRNSIVILGLHEPIKRVIIKLFSIISNTTVEYARDNYALIITILILILFVPIIYLFNEYLSVLVGKSKNKEYKHDRFLKKYKKN